MHSLLWSAFATHSAFAAFGRRLVRSRFGIAAFLIPLGIRSVPELVVGHFPVGFDTIAFYVPVTMDWVAGRAGWEAILGTAPLLYWLSVSIYLSHLLDPVWIFKILGPVLYGSLIWSLFTFLRTGLKWPGKLSLEVSLFASLYFVTLRLGWDLYRNVLGLTFILLALPLIESGSRRRLVIVAVLATLAVGTNQLVGVLVLLLGWGRVLHEAGKGNLLGSKRVGLALVPATCFFAGIVYAFFVYPTSLFPTPPAAHDIIGLPSGIAFLGYAFLPLVPFIIAGRRCKIGFDFKLWIAVSAIFSVVSVVPTPITLVTSDRWTLILDLPLCVIAGHGLQRVSNSGPSATSFMRRGFKHISIPTIFSILALLYLILPANVAFPYYSLFPNYVPSSMVQSSVPSYDEQSVVLSLMWLGSNKGPNSALITHQAIYGWARVYFPFPESIVDYQFSPPIEGVIIARQLGFTMVYLVWWLRGLGWYNLPTVPGSFILLHTEGNIGVYVYQPPP